MKRNSALLCFFWAGMHAAQALDVGFKIPADAPASKHDRDYIQMPFVRDPKNPSDDLISFRWVFGETNRGAEAGFPLSPCTFSKSAIHAQALVDILEKNPAGDDRQFLIEAGDFPSSFVSALPKCEFHVRLKRLLSKITFDPSCDLRPAPTCPGYRLTTQQE